MATDKFYLQGTDASRESFNSVRSIRFAWNMIYACNYRCPYCFFDGKWEEYGPRTVILDPGQWLSVWQRMHDRYGPISLLISGGEPFIYPRFIEIIRLISALHYPINISTNGSGDLREFVRCIDPQRVSVSLSYHQQHADLKTILDRADFVRDHGFARTDINFCLYPPYVSQLEETVSAVTARGHTLKVIPFCGRYQDRFYPDSYDPAAKKAMGMNETWEGNVRRRGRLCAAGVRSALLYPDGRVARCGQIGERDPIGSIFDENFALRAAPASCDSDLCPCIESPD